MTDIEKRCNYILQIFDDSKLSTSLIVQMVNHKYKTSYDIVQIQNALERLQRDGQVKIDELWSSGTRTIWELVK